MYNSTYRPGLTHQGRRRSLYASIQPAVLAAIDHESFSEHSLPTLSDKVWAQIAAGTSPWTTENDRLEYVGDAMMNGAIALQLHYQLPWARPHRYSALQSALRSNVTFACLLKKLNLFAVGADVMRALDSLGVDGDSSEESRSEIKYKADFFEAVMGAYYGERGFDAIYSWVARVYEPLIEAGSKAFDDWSRRQHMEALYQNSRYIWVPGSSIPLRQSPIRDRKTALHAGYYARHRSPNLRRQTSVNRKPQLTPTIIDLTMSDDDA